jgi:hypothetical protein
MICPRIFSIPSLVAYSSLNIEGDHASVQTQSLPTNVSDSSYMALLTYIFAVTKSREELTTTC